jgi:hypothetical protein
VWRDAAGSIVALSLDGSPDLCSSPPSIYYDPEGNETGGIEMVPVTPGSEEAEAFAARRRELSRGGTAAERVICP